MGPRASAAQPEQHHTVEEDSLEEALLEVDPESGAQRYCERDGNERGGLDCDH